MFLDTTQNNKNTKVCISDLVGKSFGFIKSIKMKNFGSKRMIIDDVSPNMKQYINTNDSINYAKLELRPYGLLIHIKKESKSFTWAIPYYHLVIYKTNGSTIHAQGRYIKFKKNINFKANKALFDRLLDEKVKHEIQYNILP